MEGPRGPGKKKGPPRGMIRRKRSFISLKQERKERIKKRSPKEGRKKKTASASALLQA